MDVRNKDNILIIKYIQSESKSTYENSNIKIKFISLLKIL